MNSCVLNKPTPSAANGGAQRRVQKHRQNSVFAVYTKLDNEKKAAKPRRQHLSQNSQQPRG
jgi:hypothetical protein